MLVVSANSGGLVGTTREHLGYALALEVPIFFVVSKLDLCVGGRETVEATIKQLESILTSPGVKKVPIVFFRGRHFNCHLGHSMTNQSDFTPLGHQFGSFLVRS